jgi:predicted Ser/Thr protein kinase
LKKLGKYEVLGELGHGAMGVVYRARDPIINRLVALKTITTGVADDPELLQRFYREAQSAGGLQHPNIVTIYDMGEAESLPYIAMELVEGENLEQLIARRSALPTTLKLVYAMQACRAFDYAHKRGIVHRDIKPGNVMVGKDGTVKVVDFGIARVLETSRTQTGMLIGTFAYMSPEQYHGEHADERSDIWSFGVLLYELLSYKRPFTGPTPASLMHSICNEEPTPLSNFLPECPTELSLTVSKLLRKSPADRHQSMEDVLLDLDPICKTLQAHSVADLLEQSRQLIDQDRFADARNLLRQALQVESGNQQARALLEKANAELRRTLNRPKAQQYVEKGQALLGEGKLQEARIAAENALQLDSSFAPAEDLQRVVLKELDRARLLNESLEAAKQHLVEGLPEEAESLLANILQADPANAQAQNLQQQILKEKAEREKSERLQRELDALKKLTSEKKYPEIVARTKDLLAEFPSDSNLIRLAEFAASRQANIEKELLFKKTLEEAKAFFDAGRFEEAIGVSQNGLKIFPANAELQNLYQQAEVQQRKLLIRQQIEQRIRQIRTKIKREELSDAIDMAKQTLVTLGPDTDVAHLLNSAQVELQAREKKGIQERALETIRTLLESGDHDGAGQRINEALESKTLESFDPRLQRLSEQIKDAKTPSAGGPAPSPPPVVPALSKEYAFLQPAPLPDAPPSAEKTSPLDSITAKAQSSAGSVALPQYVAPPKPEEIVPSSPEMLVQALPESTITEVKPTSFSRSAPVLPSEVQQSLSTDVLPVPAKARPSGHPASAPRWRRLAVLAILALALISSVWVGFRSRIPRTTPVSPSPSVAKPIEKPSQPSVEALNGVLTSDIEKKPSEIKQPKDNAPSSNSLQKEQKLWEDAKRFLKNYQFTEAETNLKQILALPGPGIHKADAQQYLDKTISQLRRCHTLSENTQLGEALSEDDHDFLKDTCPALLIRLSQK